MTQKTFKEVLADLKPIDHLERIVLYHSGEEIATIPNEEGKRGSLQVYAHLLGFQDGTIDRERAIRGLDLFAEHTGDADANPGKHPNIDRLFEVVEGYDLSARVVYRD